MISNRFQQNNNYKLKQMTLEVIINPSNAINEVGALPPDNLKVQNGSPLLQSSAERVKYAIKSAASDIIKVQTTDCSYNAITAYFPTSLTTNVLSILQSVTVGCNNEVPRAINELTLALQKSNKYDQMVPMTRGCIAAIVAAYNELDQLDASINVATSAVTTLARPVNTFDLSSVPNNEFLEDAITVVEQSTMKLEDIDDIPSVDVNPLAIPDTILTVLNQNPNSVGMTGAAANSDVNVTFADESEPILLNPRLEKDAETGLKTLFSMKMLGVPLSSILVDVNQMPHWEMTTIGEAQVELYVRTPIPDADIALLKTDMSYVEQDTAVTMADNSAIASTKQALKNAKWMSIQDALVEISTMSKARFTEVLFIGNKTGKRYTPRQLRSFATAMSTLWKKMKSFSFPSTASIIHASNVVSTGLGLIGNIVGKKDLVKVSDYIKMFAEGLTAFKTSATTRNLKHGAMSVFLNTFPAVVTAGLSTMEQRGVIRQSQLRTRTAALANLMSADMAATVDPAGSTRHVEKCKKMSRR